MDMIESPGGGRHDWSKEIRVGHYLLTLRSFLHLSRSLVLFSLPTTSPSKIFDPLRYLHTPLANTNFVGLTRPCNYLSDPDSTSHGPLGPRPALSSFATPHMYTFAVQMTTLNRQTRRHLSERKDDSVNVSRLGTIVPIVAYPPCMGTREGIGQY